jgi:competence protein ComEC
VKSPVPVKEEPNLILPPVFCGLGMALSYYTYPLVISAHWGLFIPAGILFVSLVIVSLLRALRFLYRNVPAVSKLGIAAVAASAGFALGIAARQNVPGPAEFGILPERVTSVSGILKEDPRTLHGGSGFGILELRECGGQGGLRASAQGSVTVFFQEEAIPRLKEFGRGCEIFIEGSLSPGATARSGRGALFRASSVHITKPASGLERFRTGLRLKLLDRFQNRRGSGDSFERAAPVWGSLASALLLGVRDDLDTDLSTGFRDSGCAHILALSGMHLAILSGLLAFLLKKPLGIRWSSLAGAVFIVFYVFVAGSQPPLVRSAIMYLIGAFSVWRFLKGKPISLLCMAFIIQLVFQSETGISLSFILSYLALLGILTLGETLRSLFRGRLPGIVNGGLSASLGAFIVTAPVVVLYFGTLRPIGIIAGLVIAPLSSLFMILSLAALIASFIPFPLWNLLDIILTLLYRVLESLVSLAGRVHGFSFSGPGPVLCFSVLIWLLLLFLQRADNLRRNSIASFD